VSRDVERRAHEGEAQAHVTQPLNPFEDACEDDSFASVNAPCTQARDECDEIVVPQRASLSRETQLLEDEFGYVVDQFRLEFIRARGRSGKQSFAVGREAHLDSRRSEARPIGRGSGRDPVLRHRKDVPEDLASAANIVAGRGDPQCLSECAKDENGDPVFGANRSKRRCR
jgi:hypothetical protein